MLVLDILLHFIALIPMVAVNETTGGLGPMSLCNQMEKYFIVIKKIAVTNSLWMFSL